MQPNDLELKDGDYAPPEEPFGVTHLCKCKECSKLFTMSSKFGEVLKVVEVMSPSDWYCQCEEAMEFEVLEKTYPANSYLYDLNSTGWIPYWLAVKHGAVSTRDACKDLGLDLFVDER